ncbi:MAG: choice-of-anchor Q domain-containing protein [Bacteroidales bacterium]|jgi:hypothetical protein|nr:choice-of-anchor Q domain-containing protein [Bacteroidales bacterium]
MILRTYYRVPLNNIVFLVSLIPASLFSQIIEVRPDGSGDALTIQQGVDMSQDGDTVLVWPGTYMENVVCNTKNITLASLALTTGDLSYKYQTIIDGNFSGSCLKIRNCLTGITVCGFTMIHGSGSFFGPLSGGGILSDVGKLNLIQCVIRDNKVTGCGGGMYCNDTEVFLSDVTICHNYAYMWGGGMELLSSPAVFDTINRCNIYLNYAGIGTEIYKLGEADTLRMVVDTFTVAAPDYYYLYSDQLSGFPRYDITYDILNPRIETANQDLYVAPWGDNDNSGLNPAEPLKQISFALLKMRSDSISPDTIHLAAGIYSLAEGQQFPLSLKAYVSIRGARRDSTFLDGNNEIHLLEGITYANHYRISDLTVCNGNGDLYSDFNGAFDIMYNQHSSFCNLRFTKNKGYVLSAGNIHNSNNFTISDVEFSDNMGGQALRAGHGHGSITFYDTVRIFNCHFLNNQPEYEDPMEGFGGCLSFIGQDTFLMTGYVYNCLFHTNHTKEYPFGAGSNSIGLAFQSRVNVINCSFGYNTSENSDGANIGVTYDSDLKVYNSIMYGNYPAEFYMYAFDGDDCNLSIYNSLVEGGEEEIRILTPWNNLYYDNTNIDTDPLWDTTSPWPYSLMAGSPCIDAGTLDLPPDIVIPETDIAGNPRVWGTSIDMGAYEYGPWVKIPDWRDLVKDESPKYLSAYPNPFHDRTLINYKSDKTGRLTLELFDSRGIFLAKMLDYQCQAGQGSFYWNGTLPTGGRLPSGIYLLRLSMDNLPMEIIKLVKG